MELLDFWEKLQPQSGNFMNDPRQYYFFKNNFVPTFDFYFKYLSLISLEGV